MTPTTDIITRLISYAGHDDDCPGRFYKESWDGLVCTCGYSAAIADAREFLEGESDTGVIEDDWTTQNGGQSRPYEESDDLWYELRERDKVNDM